MILDASKKQIELLAPARNLAIGIAAINSGADAVYIGAEKFSARIDAGNSLPDIEKLVSYAHKFYARVYVALNTILKDNELEKAYEIIKNIYSIGADALIIQDFGLLELDLPPIPLIASTQMNNDSIEKINFLEGVGFQRVILPREMTIDQIKDVRKKTSIELECFIHGALCVSQSGQCYLSYTLGGRSANRGECAQPCRQVYSLVDENGKILIKDKHLLSLKDLNLSDYLDSLIDAGVTSFKIEGRLKDLPYVKNIVSFYRIKLDNLLASKDMVKSSSGEMAFNFKPNPNKTFNRGYTDFGITGKNKDMSSINTPKSVGEKIGTVETVKDGYFTLSSKHDLRNGDGICFFDSNQVLKGSVLNKVENEKIYPNKINHLKPKTIIYRNLDSVFNKALEKAKPERKVDVSLLFDETPNGFKLTAKDTDGNMGEFSILLKKTPAEKKDVVEMALRRQFSKLNDTIFTCKEIILKQKNICIIPLSTLNHLRRGAIQNLLENREKNRPRKTGHAAINNIPYPVKNITYLGNCLNKKAENFYKRHGAIVSEWAAESGLNMKGHKVMTSKYCIKKEFDMCGKKAPYLYLMDGKKRKHRLKFDCKKCRMDVFYLSKTS